VFLLVLPSGVIKNDYIFDLGRSNVKVKDAEIVFLAVTRPQTVRYTSSKYGTKMSQFRGV